MPADYRINAADGVTRCLRYAGQIQRTPDGDRMLGTVVVEFVNEDDRAAVRAAVYHPVQNGTDYIVEFRFRHASGEWWWMEGRGRAVYGDDGTPLHL